MPWRPTSNATAAGSRPACRVTSVDDLPPSDVLMLDVSPSIAADILGDRLPDRVARSYRRFRHGPGAFKVDFAIEGDVPWTAPAARQAGTVHLGGRFDEVVANEARFIAGRCPSGRSCSSASSTSPTRPDRSATSTRCGRTRTCPTATRGTQPRRSPPRSNASLPASASGSSARQCVPTTEMSVYNPNYVGGDVIGGASSLRQLLFRPRFRDRPVLHRHPGYVSVLGVDTAGRRSARDVWCQRRRRALARLGVRSV